MSDVVPCPYCASTDDCPHLLLLVDKAFRASVGGSLMDAFNVHWFEISAAFGDDFDERALFDRLLDQVRGLADDFKEYNVHGGPISCCEYAVYFAESENSKMIALQIFSLKIQAS
jgi:hypothetical protein